MISEFALGFHNANMPDKLINLWLSEKKITVLKVTIEDEGLSGSIPASFKAKLRYRKKDNAQIKGFSPARVNGNIVTIEIPDVIANGMGEFFCDIAFTEDKKCLSTECFYLRSIEPPESLIKKE